MPIKKIEESGKTKRAADRNYLKINRKGIK